MGVVKRQGIKQSIVTYAGVVIGMVNVLFIYPAFLKEEELGIINYVRETAAMLSLFVFLGSTELVVRFFPYFKDEGKKHHGFLFLLLSIVGLGCILLLIGLAVFRHQILDWFSHKEDADLYLQFVYFIPPFTLLIAIGNLFLLYASNFHRIVIPAFINEILPKVGVPLLVSVYFLEYLSFEYIFWGSLVIYAAMVAGQIWYVWHLGHLHLQPDFKFLKKSMLKDMAHYSLFGFLGGLGSRLSSDFINVFMVGTLSTLANTGVFVIAYFIGNVIDVPRKAISRIISPLLADKWKDGRLEEIKELYQKTSINQLIVGLWLFLVIWVSIDEIYRIMPNGEAYVAGKAVVFLLGIARVADMATGANSEIISFSKYYRYNLYLILLMAAVHITASLVFIPRFEIVGAAMATLISIVLFNLAKYAVLKWRLNMQPFTWQTLWATVFAGVAYLLASLLPASGWALVDAVLKSGLLTLVFGALIWYFKVSSDLNDLVQNGLKLLRKNRDR